MSEIECDDTDALTEWLFAEHRIEVPCIAVGERRFVRLSIAPYNELADVECLRDALVVAGALSRGQHRSARLGPMGVAGGEQD